MQVVDKLVKYLAEFVFDCYENPKTIKQNTMVLGF